MRSGRREKLRPDRVTADERLRSEKRLRRVECHRRRLHEPREHTIGQSRHRVLLEQHCRHAAQRGDDDDRTRAVAAHADHERRLPRRYDAPAVGETHRDERHAAGKIDRRFPLHTAAADQIQRKPFPRHDARFDAVRRPRERHDRVGTPRQQLARNGNTRVEMSARAAARNNHA
jgi:hypothetical protein